MNSTILVKTDDAGNTTALPIRTGFFRRVAEPTALQLAVAQLEAARRDSLEHTRLAEYHAAMQAMLSERIERLGRDIARLGGNSDHKKPTPLRAALADCRDYLSGIPESEAGGDDYAQRLVRAADAALREGA